MKAVVFKKVGKIVLENVKDPQIQNPTDVIVRLTKSAICGTDLHIVRGTLPGMKSGTILGHEGVGVIEAIGDQVKNFAPGDRVIVPSTIGCGKCLYCEKEIYSQCDNANPHGSQAGTVFFGGPIPSGPLQGMQAEKVLVPCADASLIKIPDQVSDDQAILLSDILPTAYMAVEMIDPKPDDVVAVFGCGPVGQLAIACLKQLNVKEIYAIDRVADRLEIAHKQGAHIINFDETDPVTALKKVNKGHGPNKVIDAVGIDAESPRANWLKRFIQLFKKNHFKEELAQITWGINPQGGNWYPGDAPSQVLEWAVESVAKAGTISIIGVYTPLMKFFPIGSAMNKNLILRMGNCNHHKYIPMLLNWVTSGMFDPRPFITKEVPLSQAIEAYKHFDKREKGWLKVVLTFDKD